MIWRLLVAALACCFALGCEGGVVAFRIGDSDFCDTADAAQGCIITVETSCPVYRQTCHAVDITHPVSGDGGNPADICRVRATFDNGMAMEFTVMFQRNGDGWTVSPESVYVQLQCRSVVGPVDGGVEADVAAD